MDPNLEYRNKSKYEYEKSPGVDDSEPPSSLKLRSHDVLEIKQGGGLLSLFGLPFFLVGLFLCAAALGLIEFENDEQVTAIARVAVFFGALIFAIVGGVFLFGRKWYIIDRSRGTILKLKGLMIPMIRDEESLAPYSTVQVSKDSGDSDSNDRYPVALKSDSGFLVLNSPLRYSKAYRQAAYIARFLNLPLEDISSGDAVNIMPDQLKSSLGERLKTSDFQAIDGYAARPYKMRSEVRQAGADLEITIPSKRLTIWKLLPKLIPMAIAVYLLNILSDFLEDTDTPSEIKIWLTTLLLIFLVGFPVLGIIGEILRSKLGYSRLIVSKEEITIREKGIWKGKSTPIPFNGLIDISYRDTQAKRDAVRKAASESMGRNVGNGTATIKPNQTLNRILDWAGQFIISDGILIKSKQGLFKFGSGLSDEEAAYLARLIKEKIRYS